MQKTDNKNGGQYYLNAELNKTLGLVRHLCENSNKIVLLNGPEGIGKTSLVHQFAEQNKQYLHCEIVHARAGYSAEQLASEIAVAYGSSQPIHTDNPASLITTFDHLFEDRDRVERQPVIIVDGLNNLPESTRVWLSRLYQASLNSSLLSIIVTVDAEDGALDLSLILPGLNELNIHSIELPTFTLEDAQNYLLSDNYAETASLQLSAKEIKKFFKKTHGIPLLLLQYAQAVMKEKSDATGAFKRKKEKLMSDEKNYDEEDEIIMEKFSAKPDNELEELEQELKKRKRSKKKSSFFEKNKITIIAVAGVLIAILILQSYINKLFEPEAEQNSTELALPDEQESILDILDDSDDGDSDDLFSDDNVTEEEPIDPLAELRMAEPEPVESEKASKQEQMQRDFGQLSEGLNKQVTEAETVVAKTEVTPSDNSLVAPVELSSPIDLPTQVKLNTTEPEVQSRDPEVVAKPEPQKPVEKERVTSDAMVSGQRSNDWVLEQNGQRFTMQLSGASSPDSYKRFINKHRLDSDLVTIVKTQRNGKDWYSLLYGNYPTKAAAQIAVKSFPKIKGIWVRPFKDIQKQL